MLLIGETLQTHHWQWHDIVVCARVKPSWAVGWRIKCANRCPRLWRHAGSHSALSTSTMPLSPPTVTHTASFLSRVSTLTRDIDIAILSVRLSARPSVRNVPVLDDKGLTYCHIFSTIRYSPIILVSSASNIFTKFRRGHPPVHGGAKYR